MIVKTTTACQLQRSPACAANCMHSSSASERPPIKVKQPISSALNRRTAPSEQKPIISAAARRNVQYVHQHTEAFTQRQQRSVVRHDHTPGAASQRSAELLLVLAVAALGAAVMAQPDGAWAQAAQHTAAAVQQSAKVVQNSAQTAQQEGSASAGLLRFFMEDVKAMGSLAPAGYLVGVAGFELLPVLAPRPFSSVSGLLFGVLRLRLWLSLLAGLVFGPLQGAALNLAGTTGAAAIAFAKARQDEGPSALLQQIQKEDSSGTILKVYERVKGVIDSGSLVQQASVITVLRIVPFAPFRAVSYYLGLTPIRFSAYVAGTAAGRGFWALLYASIGAYSRTWMQRGIGLDGVLQELGEAAGLFTTEAIVTGVVLSVGAAGGWGLGVVGPDAPGLPEEGHYLDRLRERRDIAKEGAIGFLRQLVPSDEWLTAGFWRQTAQKAKTAGKRVVGVLLDDGEGDLADWLEHKGTDSPLRAQAAKALQALKSGAEQAGLDPGALRKQVKELGKKLDGQGSAGESGSDGTGGNGSGTDGSESRSPGDAKVSQSRMERQQGSKHHE